MVGMTDYLYTITGVVIDGDKRGRLLGYPTANIALQQEIPEGVYISHVDLGGKQYNALTFIGSAKTFNDTTYKSETFILDFDQDIYGKTLTVGLLEHLRGNQKFHSKEALIEQMERDKQAALEFFESH